jgi:hypothetical protein
LIEYYFIEFHGSFLLSHGLIHSIPDKEDGMIARISLTLASAGNYSAFVKLHKVRVDDNDKRAMLNKILLNLSDSVLPIIS